MQRDWDVIKQILLAVERIDERDSFGKVFPNVVSGGKFQDHPEAMSFVFHYKLLISAGFINGQASPSWIVSGLTWSGHDLIQKLRES